MYNLQIFFSNFQKALCGEGFISNTKMFAIPLNPPYQRGTFKIEVLSDLKMIVYCYCICSVLFQISLEALGKMVRNL